MVKSVDLLWEEALDLLKDELSEISLNTWVKPIKPIEIRENTIYFEVQLEFTKNMLENRYCDLIKNAFFAACGTEFDIEFLLPSEINQPDAPPDNTVIHRKDSPLASLNPENIFETFVVGNSNRFAHAASVAVAEAPANAYNPLFLYGKSGLGKTHLMQAISHYILKQNPKMKIMYVSSEKFTNELINAIRDERTDERSKDFREKYRNVDVLLIDDIHFIAGKERTQEEFFHTFNSLYENNKQIVISSDNPPSKILTLEERLRSRFEHGLIADLQAPDYETRVAILRKKAQSENVIVPNDVTEYIANNFQSNIRNLQGALTRVIAYASLTGNSITLEMTQDVLRDIIARNNINNITIPYIIDAVAKHYHISSKELISKKRNREIAFPRQIAMYLCRKHTSSSLPQIGREFGGRDHTTVLHSCDKINTLLRDDISVNSTIEEISRRFEG
ncbi:MAG: chromosomal replication initiator protein DnaA [Clostridia bacterium]|nr:chromosomal replication initiator protein DnaA [Clostridia bacterium]